MFIFGRKVLSIAVGFIIIYTTIILFDYTGNNSILWEVMLSEDLNELIKYIALTFHDVIALLVMYSPFAYIFFYLRKYQFDFYDVLAAQIPILIFAINSNFGTNKFSLIFNSYPYGLYTLISTIFISLGLVISYNLLFRVSKRYVDVIK